MEYLVLTQYTGKILGPIAKYILGPILNGVFIFLDWLPWKNSANVGVAIIIFTIVIYLLLLPLTIKQQKFSKLQSKMQPELQAIQNKYKGKKDQDSQMAMNQETQQVYSKYGVSPTGSCLPLLIQMPILFALYRVIYSIPAYVPMVKNAYTDIVNGLIEKEGSSEFIQGLSSATNFTNQFSNEAFTSGDVEYVSNTFIDVLNRASESDWLSISEKFPDLSSIVDSTMETLKGFNNFFGMNIGYSPSEIIKTAFTDKNLLICVAAILVPVLSAVTQWINVKLTPGSNNTQKTGNEQADQMASSMKAMNTFMPIMSAVFCFTLPTGMGIYWIAGSVVRSVQQVLINKHIDKLDLDAEIKKNVEKKNKRLKRAGIDPETLMANANRSTRSMASKATVNNSSNVNSNANKGKQVDNTEYYNKNTAKPGSIAAKANMVKQYNEKNNQQG